MTKFIELPLRVQGYVPRAIFAPSRLRADSVSVPVYKEPSTKEEAVAILDDIQFSIVRPRFNAGLITSKYGLDVIGIEIEIKNPWFNDNKFIEAARTDGTEGTRELDEMVNALQTAAAKVISNEEDLKAFEHVEKVIYETEDDLRTKPATLKTKEERTTFVDEIAEKYEKIQNDIERLPPNAQGFGDAIRAFKTFSLKQWVAKMTPWAEAGSEKEMVARTRRRPIYSRRR